MHLILQLSKLKKTYLEEFIMTFEKIQAIIVDQLDKEVEEVQLATNFREDLDADSLDLFQIINDIEDEFDIKIESDEGINTVEDLVKYVDAQLAE
jgi:acyl carrier protein